MASEFNVEHALYAEKLFTTRFIKHTDLRLIIDRLNESGVFKVGLAGTSVQQRDIYHVTAGHGAIQIMLWSQMHGDEPTGTHAFFDLFNFFTATGKDGDLRSAILNNCTLHFIPMVNPDGAAVHNRRNAQGIDINRDFLAQQSPEGRILTQLYQEIKPDFCFNMHDQETLWSVSGTNQPASISLLAPPADEMASLAPNRTKAMQVVAGIHRFLQDKLKGSIGRWSEEYEPRAFGDNFQKLGSATILIEGGGYDRDFERQHVRKLTFELMLHALKQIATGQYEQEQLSDYYSIPFNNKQIFHLLIKNCKIKAGGTNITADIGLNYTELLDLKGFDHQKIYTVVDIGDLSTWNAYEVVDAGGAGINATITLDMRPTLKMTVPCGNTLHMENGVRLI